MFDFDVAAALDRAAAAARAECVAVAAKLAAAAEVARLRQEADGRDQVPVSRQAEFVAAEVATALSVSTGAAHAMIDLGQTLAVRLPGVRRALEDGVLDLTRVRVIAERTAVITDPGVLAEVEARALAVVGMPGRCVTRGQVARATDRVVASVDPGSVVERRRRAVADRCLEVRAGTDGMSRVWGEVAAGDGVVLDARLRAVALAVCGADPRTLDQRRADALVGWARGRTELDCRCGSPTCPSTPTRPGPTVVVQVVVDAAVLLGAVDLPGVLARYGIVDPETVRTLSADARWQRMLTLDGTPAELGPLTGPGPGCDTPQALRYTPGDKLADLVRTRDGHCRFPGCTVPAASCDLDHVIPFNHEHRPGVGARWPPTWRVRAAGTTGPRPTGCGGCGWTPTAPSTGPARTARPCTRYPPGCHPPRRAPQRAGQRPGGRGPHHRCCADPHPHRRSPPHHRMTYHPMTCRPHDGPPTGTGPTTRSVSATSTTSWTLCWATSTGGTGPSGSRP